MWQRSTLVPLNSSPFDWGWYAIVWCNWMPNSFERADHSPYVNALLLPEVMCSGRLACDLHESICTGSRDLTYYWSSFGPARRTIRNCEQVTISLWYREWDNNILMNVRKTSLWFWEVTYLNFDVTLDLRTLTGLTIAILQMSFVVEYNTNLDSTNWE